jgi:hypothetical protein
MGESAVTRRSSPFYYLRVGKFRCALRGRLEEDVNGEIDWAAMYEQPDRLVQVDVGPRCDLSGRERVIAGPYQLLDAPPLHALDLRLDDLVYRRHPRFLYAIFLSSSNADVGLVDVILVRITERFTGSLRGGAGKAAGER